MKIKYLFVFLIWSASVTAQMQAFSLKEVSLSEGIFKNAQDVDLKYILALEPDKLLAPYLIDAGLPLKADRYGNWESSGLDGHIGGHYLSALAMMYASTGNAEVKKRLDYMVSELARCQTQNANGYVGGIPQGKIFWDRIHKGDIDGSGFGLNNTWVPFYNIHKLYAGLRDAYEYAHNEQAKEVLIKLGDWLIELLRPLSDAQVQQILRTEHGGINESFADIFIITKDPKYLDMALRLSHRAILEPLIERQDKLTGLHANTQIPKVIGFEKIGLLRSKQDWAAAAQYFWQNVSQTRSVAFGGNSVREHFNPVNDFSKMLSSNQGPETCNSYNMLRLSKALFLDKNDVSYLDFYERTLYNHILSSQHPEKGGFVYFTPIRPNHYRVYSQPETSMWCCVGSGIENHAKYNELIYSHSADDIFVNLFIPSNLDWKAKGIQMIQHTAFPYKNQTELILNLNQARSFALNIRYPEWAEQFQVFIKGKKYSFEAKPKSYVSINRKWKSGDKIIVRFKTSPRLEKLPDGSDWVAFLNGPIVLAAKTSAKDMTGLFADGSRMGHETKGPLYPIDKAFPLINDTGNFISQLKPLGNLRFGLDSLLLQPFFEIHEARYQMYFPTFTQKAYDTQQMKLKQKEKEFLATEARTIDKVNCGEQQSEVDHNFKGEKSNAGYDDEQFWRSTRAYFSYQLQNKNLVAKYLEIDILGDFGTEDIKILINGKPIEMVKKETKLVGINTANTELIEVKVEVVNNKPSPRFVQFRLMQ